MAFNRDALRKRVKKTPISATIANSSTRVDQPFSGYLDRKARVGYRLMPTLSTEKGAFYAPIRCVSYLPVEVERDGETKMVNKPIFNSRVHLSTRDDIVERYVRFIQANQTAFDNYDEIDQALGYYKTSIKPQTARVAYALELDPDNLDEDGNPVVTGTGRMDLKSSVWSQLTAYATDEDAHDKPLSYDPFDDIDEGLWYVQKYDKNSRPSYKVTVKGSFAIPDEYLEMLSKAEPIDSRLKYRATDWDYQLEGLRNFDSAYSVGLFDSPEFQAIVQEVYAEVRSALEAAEGDVGGSSEPQSTVATPESTETKPDATGDVKAVKAKIQKIFKAYPDLKGRHPVPTEKTVESFGELLALYEADVAAREEEVELEDF